MAAAKCDVFWLVDGGARDYADEVITVRECSTWREARRWYEARVGGHFVEVFDRDGKVILDHGGDAVALSFEMSAPRVPGRYTWSEGAGHVRLHQAGAGAAPQLDA